MWAWDAAERVQGRRASPRLWTRVRAMRRLSLQSESEVSLHLNLLLRLPRVGGSSESLDLGAGGEGLQETVALRYLTKVEKTHQVELVATADGG